jgi:hypothetical protein
MDLGRGKLTEAIKVQSMMTSTRMGSGASFSTVYYNGIPLTNNGGVGVDTMDYEDMDVLINAGAWAGPLLTVGFSLYESATDDPSVATAVPGTSITLGVAGGSTWYEGSVAVKDRKRYLFAKVAVDGATAITADISIVGILGGAVNQPVAKTLKFDL